MCDKAVEKSPGSLEYVPNEYKNQGDIKKELF